MADLFFDDLDEEEDDEQTNVAAKPLPGFYQELIGNLSDSKGDKTQARQTWSGRADEEESSKPFPEVEPVPQARYWWEEGYKEPTEGVQTKEKKRVFNRKTGCYEDVGAPASRSPSVSSKASSRAPSSHAGLLPGSNVEVEGLDDVLGRIDADMVSDQLPGNYHARPVPRRAWNPDAGNFEVVNESAIVAWSSSSSRGWIPRKEGAPSEAPLPIEDVLRHLDNEEQSPRKEPETRLLAIRNEAESQASPVALSSSEMPVWSREKQKHFRPVTEDLKERYANDEEVETPSLHATQEPDYVRQVKRAEELRRRKREKVIQEAIAEDPELEEYFRPQAESTGEQQNDDLTRFGKLTQSGPAEQRTTVAQDQGEGQVNLRPTKREPLPGMGRQKRRSDVSSSSSQPVKEVPMGTSASSTWSGFSLLPGMPLPFELGAGSSSASRQGAPAKAPAAGLPRASSSAAQASSSSTAAAKPASSEALAEKLRSHRQRLQEDDDDEELQEAFQSIGGSRGFQPKRAPAKFLPKSLARASAKASTGKALPKYEDLVGAIDSMDTD